MSSQRLSRAVAICTTGALELRWTPLVGRIEVESRVRVLRLLQVVAEVNVEAVPVERSLSSVVAPHQAGLPHRFVAPQAFFGRVAYPSLGEHLRGGRIGRAKTEINQA